MVIFDQEVKKNPKIISAASSYSIIAGNWTTPSKLLSANTVYYNTIPNIHYAGTVPTYVIIYYGSSNYSSSYTATFDVSSIQATSAIKALGIPYTPTAEKAEPDPFADIDSFQAE